MPQEAYLLVAVSTMDLLAVIRSSLYSNQISTPTSMSLKVSNVSLSETPCWYFHVGLSSHYSFSLAFSRPTEPESSSRCGYPLFCPLHCLSRATSFVLHLSNHLFTRQFLFTLQSLSLPLRTINRLLQDEIRYRNAPHGAIVIRHSVMFIIAWLLIHALIEDCQLLEDRGDPFLRAESPGPVQ